MEALVVGDIHAKTSNLAETKRLLLWIAGLHPDLPIIFLGDQLDTFGVARVEVVALWRQAIEHLLLERSGEIYFIVGNHDMNHAGTHNFIDLFQVSPRIHVIDRPTVLNDSLFMPFVRDNELFLQHVNKCTQKTVFCHQEFDGAQFENGFYAPHGVNIEDITTSAWIVSGHIHERQNLGDKVFYPGTPRGLTKSDANKGKGVHLINSDTRSVEFIPTPEVVAKPFRLINVDNTTDLASFKVSLKDPERLYVHITGTAEFIKKILRIKDIKKAKITTEYTDEAVSNGAIKESEGIDKAFNKYAISYFDKNDLGAIEIKALWQLVSKYCPSLTTK